MALRAGRLALSPVFARIFNWRLCSDFAMAEAHVQLGLDVSRHFTAHRFWALAILKFLGRYSKNSAL